MAVAGNVSVATAPTVEPVTLAEAREHCRLVASGSPESHPDDDFLTRAIKAARQMAENFTGRAFVETQYTWRFDRFTSSRIELSLPVGPGRSVDSISYVDDDGTTQTFTDFVLVATDTGGRLAPTTLKSWPDSRGSLGDVTITFKAGYAPTSDSPPDYRANVPADIKNAILFAVGHMYTNRSSVEVDVNPEKVPMAFEHMLWPYRLSGL